MKKRRIILSLLVLFLIGMSHVNAQLMTVHKVVNYEPQQYFAHNQNWQTVQDDRGVLFFANGDGVLQYDGTNWKLYQTETRTNVLSVGIAENGQIFYGGVGEVGFLSPNKSGEYQAKRIKINGNTELFEAEFFWDIHILDNKVIFRSDNSLVIYSEGKSIFLDLSAEKYRGSFVIGSELWFQNQELQLFKVKYKELHSASDILPIEELKGQTPYIIQRIIPTSATSKEVIIVSNDKGIFSLNTSNFHLKQFDCQLNELSKLSVDEAILLPFGELVISTTNSGVYVLSKSGDIITHYNESNGLKTNAIRGIFYDREGLLWFNSDVGISKALFNKPFSWLPDGFSKIKGNANAIIEKNEVLYIASNEGVYRIRANDGQIEVNDLSNLNIQAFDIISVDEDIIAATTGGLIQFSDGNVIPIMEAYSRAIVALSDTYIIVGGRKSMFQLKKEQGIWRVVDSTSMPDEFLHLELDLFNTNVLWGGMYSSGVARITVDTISHAIKSEVFNPKFAGVEGYILPFTGLGKMLFAPKSSGAYYFNESSKTFELEPKIATLLNEDISCWVIKQDKYGNVYIEDSGPIYILRKNENDYFVDSTSLTNLNIGYVNDVFCSLSGITWLIGEEGIVKFDPKENKTYQEKFYTLINGVFLNTDSTLFKGSFFDGFRAVANQQTKTVLIHSDYRNVSFSFSSPQFASEKGLLYSYQLVGYDEHFSEWNSDTKAVYTNLSEGNYIFKVKAINSEGIESELGQFYFSISPPWYRTMLAYIVYFLLFVLVVVLSVRIYSARLKKSNIKLQNIVNEKTKVITANMEELASQKEQLEERNNDIIGSIHYAQRLQNAILPSTLAFKKSFSNSFIYYHPKDIVAGDFYWMNTLKSSEEVLVAVADCTGHGVPGALVSVVCSDALNRAVNEFKLTEPNEILDAVNQMVLETFNADNIGQDTDYLVRDGMDLALCKFNEQTKSLTFTGANSPLWIVTNREMDLKHFYIESDLKIYELKGDRQPIGGYSNQDKFKSITIDCKKGDIVYMFTDGIVDQFGSWNDNDKNKKFKRINLAKLLIQINSLEISSQKDKLHEVFEKWKGENEQIDDVTIIGIKIS